MAKADRSPHGLFRRLRLGKAWGFPNELLPGAQGFGSMGERGPPELERPWKVVVPRLDVSRRTRAASAGTRAP